MSKLLRRLGLNFYTEKEVKSFETHFRERERSWINQNFYNTGVETQSQFSSKSLKQSRLSDYPIFATNYTTIKAKTLDRDTFIKSDRPELSRQIEDQLLELGVNKKFFRDCFDELYLGTAKLIYFNDKNQITALPFLRGRQEIVRLTYSKVQGDITKIEVLQESGSFGNFDLDQPYYILYNQKQDNTYLSNLTIATPYIEVQNRLTQKEVRFIDGDFTGKPIISPKLDKILPNKESGSFDVSLGGETYDFLDFVSGAWKGLVKEIKQQIQKEKFPILPFGVDIKDLTKSNTDNQTDKFRDWLDDMIIISCLSSASITGKKGTNRAVSEQDRDNLEEVTILAFQDKLSDIVNEFILPLLLPQSYKGFKFAFYRENTDETLQIRTQAQKTYEILSDGKNIDLLARVGLGLNKDQVKAIFKNAHGIDLDDIVVDVDVVETEEIKSVKKYSYGCVMLNLESTPEIEEIKKYFVENNLTSTDKDNRDVKNGIQNPNHVTLLYGLEPDVNLENVVENLKEVDLKVPEFITINKFIIFEKDNYDVLALEPTDEVSSKLTVWNEQLKKLPYTNDYPDYKPHITIAYLKKGEAKKYVDKYKRKLKGLKIKSSQLVFSTADNLYHSIEEIKSIDQSKVKVPKHIEFDLDILSNYEYQMIKIKLAKGLTSQYEAIADQGIKSYLENVNYIDREIKIDVSNVNLFDKYITRSEFKSLLDSFVGTVKSEYNQKIKDLGGKIPQNVLDLIDETVKFTYDGGTYTQIDSKGKANSTLYAGFENTQKEKLKNIEKLDRETITKLVKNDIERFEASLFVPLFNETYQEIAIDDGSKWIWTISKNDSLVRPWHIANNFTAHKIGGQLKDNTNKLFYLERNCRCSRGYGSLQDMINNGFEIIKSL